MRKKCRPSVCDLILESQPFVGISLNFLQIFFLKKAVERAFHENRVIDS